MKASKEVKEWWEKSSKSFQEVSKIPTSYAHYGPCVPNENQLRLLGNVKGKRVLEIGCGGAQCSIAFAKQGAIATGIDISAEQLKFARKLAEKNKVKIKLYQGDIHNLKQIKNSSQDIVFSAFALHYIENLLKCFKEARRVLKKKGLFVFSLDHPFYRTIHPKTLRVRESYFKTGKKIERYGKDKFVMFNRTVSEIYNNIVKAGFLVEKIIEPKPNKKDPGARLWWGLWDYTEKLLKNFTPTIIFKCRKI